MRCPFCKRANRQRGGFEQELPQAFVVAGAGGEFFVSHPGPLPPLTR